MKKMIEDVAKFHAKFGFDDPSQFNHKRLYDRGKFQRQESNEFIDAVIEGDVVGQVDAAIDMMYVIIGTALLSGYADKLADHWDAVQACNMAKERGENKNRPGSGGFDAVKPAGWVGPDERHKELLENQDIHPACRETGAYEDTWQ